MRFACASSERNQKKSVSSFAPSELGIPRRFWTYILARVDLSDSLKWGGVSKANIRKIVEQLKLCRFSVVAKGPPGEEFVLCGGVNVSEINLKTMESKIVKGLYLAGEVINIDGLTGIN